MIKLKDLLKEIVDGKGHMTAEKFGSICLNQLKRAFPQYEVDLFDVADFIKDQVKHKMTKRISIHNSCLRARFHIETNDKLYFVNIVNEFDKVPESELSNKFTMADDNHLINMPSNSLEPKDFNTPNALMRFRCKMVLQNTDGNTLLTLIPKKEISYIHFTDYNTLDQLIHDVKTKIDSDKFNEFGRLNEIEDESDAPLLHSISEITPSVKQEIAKTAQHIYDEWDQEGEHDELNGGGICHIIADGIIDVLYNHKINDCQTVSSNFEQHVYVVGRFKEGIYSIDIPYSIYETGGGFTWKKIPEVIFSEHDIQIYHLDSDPNSFDQYVDMMENTSTLTLESMTMSYVSNESDGERMGRLDTLLGLSGHLESLLYRIMYTLPVDQIAYFRKNRKPYLLIPDGDADIFSPTGVLNLYYAGYTKATLELLLRAIFVELKKRNITCAAPKIEDSRSYNCKVVRLDITANNYKHEGPDDINLSNRNFYHILKSLLGFEPDDSSGSSFSFTVKELKDKITLILKHDPDWISKNQIKNIPDAEKGDDDVETENPHSAFLKHTFSLLGPTHHISELDKDRIMDILNRLLKYCEWCEKHGYKNLVVG